MPVEAKAWGGFKQGQAIQANIPEGLYPAKLVSIETIDTTYGPRLRLTYRIEFDGETRNVSELCSETFSAGSKFIKRLAAVNGRQITEDDDLSELKTSGPVVVKLTIDQNDYNKVDDVLTPSALNPRRTRQTAKPVDDSDSVELAF